MTDKEENGYRITYSIWAHPDGVPKAEVPDDRGACDALVMVSILLPGDGSYQQAITTMNGFTGKDLDPDDLWKVWAVMSQQLAESDGVTESRKMLCRLVHEAVTAEANANEGKNGG